MKAAEFLRSFKFRVTIDGRFVGISRVSEIEYLIARSGNGYCKPITIESAPKAGTGGLAEALGSRPWARRDVTLTESTREGETGRVIRLRSCKLKGYTIAEHDAMADGVVIDRVKLHPKRIDIVAGPAKSYVKPRPVAKIEPGLPPSEVSP